MRYADYSVTYIYSVTCGIARVNARGLSHRPMIGQSAIISSPLTERDNPRFTDSDTDPLEAEGTVSEDCRTWMPAFPALGSPSRARNPGRLVMTRQSALEGI